MPRQKKTAKVRFIRSDNPTRRRYSPNANTIHLNWAIFTSTICLLVIWNYWAPFAFMNPFAVPPEPFAMLGTASNDFHIFYTAGQMWLAHQNPYVGSFIYYPPTTLPFFGLFALLNFTQATTMWALTYFLTFLAAICSIAMSLDSTRKIVFVAVASLLLFTSYPFLVLFGLGQIDLWISSLTILSLGAYRLNHPVVSASVLALATILKGLPAIFLIYFVLFNHDLRYLLRFIAAVLAMVCLSLLIVPLNLFTSYLAGTLGLSVTTLAAPYNQSIPGLLALLGLGRIIPIVWFVGLALFAFFALLCSKKPDSSDYRDLRQNAMFLMNALVLLLLGTRATVYPYVWVIIPIAMFLCTLLVCGAERWYLLRICLATFMLNAVLSIDLLNFRTLPLELLGNVVLTLSLIRVQFQPKQVIQEFAVSRRS